MPPRKPNYNQERANRERAKQAKKNEKLKKLEERTAERKATVEQPSGDGGSER